MNYKFEKLFSNDFLRVSRALIRKFDLHTAIMLSEIYSEYTYWHDKKQLQNNYFYSTINNIKNNTGLSKHQQEKACNKLVLNNLIDIKYHDLPRKRYFKLNVSQLNKLYDELNIPINTSETHSNLDKILDDDTTSENAAYNQNVNSSNYNSTNNDKSSLVSDIVF